ncbi:hypothetical protein BG006_002172 [Podila minutissima]|uniref:Major facilitator superfamily (MFS) profile domain-containing protein n=1 Tax=Podila minutissima TaxID=64525 RepID=A0A9P5VNV2_9FUNG|nr:hypothetical protein BG006_002172 [Podila minutissima]
MCSFLIKPSQMSWVATSYLIAYNTFNRLYGRLSDIFGRKNKIIFLLGSIGYAAASSLIMLILFRAVQGFGACGLSPTTRIIVGDMFADVLPFQPSVLSRVDYLGAFFVMETVTYLLLPLSTGGTSFAWNSPAIISMICVFVALFGTLVLVQFHATEAIIPPALFKNRDIVILYFVNCVVGPIFMGCTFYVPLYFQIVQGTSATVTGVRLMPNVNAVPLLPKDVRVLVVRAYADGFQFLFKVLTPIVGLALLLSLFLR